MTITLKVDPAKYAPDFPEVEGVIRGGRRWVALLDVDGADAIARYIAALEYLDDNGYGPYDRLGTTNLFIVERIPGIFEGDPAHILVEVRYERRNATVMQFGNVWRMVHSTALQDVTTQLDGNGEQITVEHTFPSDDEDFPGQTVVQGGEVSVLEPEETYTIYGRWSTSYAGGLRRQLLRRMNAAPWAGHAAGTVLCTRCEPQAGNEEESPYRTPVSIEFQVRPGGWDPAVAFQDSRTNKPPSGIVAGQGYKQVSYYPSVDFNEYFPVVGV